MLQPQVDQAGQQVLQRAGVAAPGVRPQRAGVVVGRIGLAGLQGLGMRLLGLGRAQPAWQQHRRGGDELELPRVLRLLRAQGPQQGLALVLADDAGVQHVPGIAGAALAAGVAHKQQVAGQGGVVLLPQRAAAALGVDRVGVDLALALQEGVAALEQQRQAVCGPAPVQAGLPVVGHLVIIHQRDRRGAHQCLGAPVLLAQAVVGALEGLVAQRRVEQAGGGIHIDLVAGQQHRGGETVYLAQRAQALQRAISGARQVAADLQAARVGPGRALEQAARVEAGGQVEAQHRRCRCRCRCRCRSRSGRAILGPARHAGCAVDSRGQGAGRARQHAAGQAATGAGLVGQCIKDGVQHVAGHRRSGWPGDTVGRRRSGLRCGHLRRSRHLSLQFCRCRPGPEGQADLRPQHQHQGLGVGGPINGVERQRALCHVARLPACAHVPGQGRPACGGLQQQARPHPHRQHPHPFAAPVVAAPGKGLGGRQAAVVGAPETLGRSGLQRRESGVLRHSRSPGAASGRHPGSR